MAGYVGMTLGGKIVWALLMSPGKELFELVEFG